MVIPTRGRPEKLAEVLVAWENTKASDLMGVDMVVVADDDDPRIRDYEELVTAAIIGGASWLSLTVEPVWLPMVHKLDKAAVALAPYYLAVGFAGDDHLPRTRDWPSRYLEELMKLGTGIVYGNDGHHGERFPTEWAMTSNIIKALGRMVPAPVEHLYCDNSILDLGRAAGCIQYVSDVTIEHMHPMWNKTEWDPQYEKVNGKEQYRKDGIAYRRWHHRQLAQDVLKIRGIG